MNLEVIRRIARDNMEKRRFQLEREPGYVYYHGQRVANLAGEILSRKTGDDHTIDPVLFAGALFHDIGKGFDAHNDAGADVARSLLKGCCGAEELDQIERIVRFHCIRKHGLDLEERILAVQDADLIDHYGTQEIWLNFMRAAYHDGSERSVIEWWESETFQRHIAESRALINFEISKTLLEERLAYHSSFLARFKVEAEGGIAAGALPAEYRTT